MHTKRKTMIGIILIVLSIAALVFWETSGRKLCTTKEVLAAGTSLKAGDTINIEEMISVRLPSENAAKSWLSPQQAELLNGRICAVDIESGEPLTEAMFREKNGALSEGRSIFSIPQDWIASRPAMLRAGDTVTLYSLQTELMLGTYEIAFTRDNAEQAITGDEASSSDVLSRDTSSGIISSIEIICTPAEYFKLYKLSLTSGREPEENDGSGEENVEKEGENGEDTGEYAGKSDGFGSYPDSGYGEVPGEEKEAFLLIVLKEAR